MASEYTIGQYLLDRLVELGIHHLFGVPGDYNLNFLSQVVKDDRINWVGNRNELNGAYAADGYARINGIAALVTTYGVGELSAINGVAGSFAEEVPVVAITGLPATSIMQAGGLVHHTLGDGRFGHFIAAYREVTAAQTLLTAENAAEEIDRVLRVCWQAKRPVYIALPADVTGHPTDPPRHPLLESTDSSVPASPETTEAADSLVARLQNSTFPVILADFEVLRHNAQRALREFVEASGFPVASFSMGKGVIDENHPQFIGVYNGNLSDDSLHRRISESDCVVMVGVKLVDTITGSFTHGITADRSIDIHPHTVTMDGHAFENVDMKSLLHALSTRLTRRDPRSLNILPASRQQAAYRIPFIASSDAAITQDRFWLRFSQFLEEGDVLITEQGTAFFGASSLPIPKAATCIGQPLWGSIGYTLPALLGSQLADPSRRNILVIGDGSFQLTVQELSTMIQWRIRPVILLLNNDGYTVERAIHGPFEPYNDIPMWDYQQFPRIFGDSTCLTHRVATEKELDDALDEAELAKDHLTFIEVIMGRLDTPELLSRLGRAMAAQNHY
jgi:indolepyruvate decarboxylase